MKDDFVIDNFAPPGVQWYAVTDPYEKDLAQKSRLIRSTATRKERNEERRETHRVQKASPYLQVSLQHNKLYQKKLKEILK